jgi:hypothetical protein
MKNCAAILAMAAVCSTSLRADVRYTATTRIEGQMAGMMGAAPPRMVMRLKGGKARADVGPDEQPTASSITNLASKQMILLQHAQKAAVVVTQETASTLARPGSITLPEPDASVKATGQSRIIDGVSCAEHAVTMSFSMVELSKSAQTLKAPPDVLEQLKDARMVVSGSLWVATEGPGVSDYVGFKKIAEEAGLAGVLLGAVPGMRAGGLNKFMTAFATAPGLPYLTEITMTVEGTGEMVQMMKQQMGITRVTTWVSAVSTEPIADDVFTVPDGYKVTQR